MDDKYNCHYDDNDTSTNNYRGTYHYEPNFEEQKPEPPNTFATASLVLGILSLVLCCCCYVSIPLGGLGILFAILSKTGKASSSDWYLRRWLFCVIPYENVVSLSVGCCS